MLLSSYPNSFDTTNTGMQFSLKCIFVEIDVVKSYNFIEYVERS